MIHILRNVNWAVASSYNLHIIPVSQLNLLSVLNTQEAHGPTSVLMLPPYLKNYSRWTLALWIGPPSCMSLATHSDWSMSTRVHSKVALSGTGMRWVTQYEDGWEWPRNMATFLSLNKTAKTAEPSLLIVPLLLATSVGQLNYRGLLILGIVLYAYFVLIISRVYSW